MTSFAPARAPEPPAEGEVRVWLVRIGEHARDDGSLSAFERERAARLRFDEDCRRYVAAHVALRRVLGAASGREPRALVFDVGEHGKPSLADDAGLFFNLSHSGERALIAVTRIARVGVDVERARPFERMEDVARRFFSPAEVEALLALPPHERATAFFRCWTRKEAYVKALGEGLGHALDRFAVSLDAGAGARFVSFDEEPGALGRWSLVDLDVDAGYAGALALESPAARVAAAELA